jgi:hypothetical protein
VIDQIKAVMGGIKNCRTALSGKLKLQEIFGGNEKAGRQKWTGYSIMRT